MKEEKGRTDSGSEPRGKQVSVPWRKKFPRYSTVLAIFPPVVAEQLSFLLSPLIALRSTNTLTAWAR